MRDGEASKELGKEGMAGVRGGYNMYVHGGSEKAHLRRESGGPVEAGRDKGLGKRLWSQDSDLKW